MKIETIRSTRSPTGKLRLQFDDGSSLLVPPSVILDMGLYAGLEIPDGGVNAIRDSAGEYSAKERALRIISATSVTEKELRRRLRQKGEQEGKAEKAVHWLKDLDLLDDRKVAEQIVAQGIAKGYGKSRLRQLLYEKGVPKELWEEALADLPDPEVGIRTFLTKRFRGKRPDEKERKRAADALLRRGYRWSDIRPVIEEYASDSGETEMFEFDDSLF
ncbi:MAG: regulatory protein RecX [Oscillospiraceae bacterium]|nr:regulatory protein RecX [Oscillospiraceae bacterium]